MKRPEEMTGEELLERVEAGALSPEALPREASYALFASLTERYQSGAGVDEELYLLLAERIRSFAAADGLSDSPNEGVALANAEAELKRKMEREVLQEKRLRAVRCAVVLLLAAFAIALGSWAVLRFRELFW